MISPIIKINISSKKPNLENLKDGEKITVYPGFPYKIEYYKDYILQWWTKDSEPEKCFYVYPELRKMEIIEVKPLEYHTKKFINFIELK